MKMINLTRQWIDRGTEQVKEADHYYPAERILEIGEVTGGRRLEDGNRTLVTLAGPDPSPFREAGAPTGYFRVFTNKPLRDLVEELESMT